MFHFFLNISNARRTAAVLAILLFILILLLLLFLILIFLLLLLFFDPSYMVERALVARHSLDFGLGGTP